MSLHASIPLPHHSQILKHDAFAFLRIDGSSCLYSIPTSLTNSKARCFLILTDICILYLVSIPSRIAHKFQSENFEFLPIDVSSCFHSPPASLTNSESEALLNVLVHIYSNIFLYCTRETKRGFVCLLWTDVQLENTSNFMYVLLFKKELHYLPRGGWMPHDPGHDKDRLPSSKNAWISFLTHYTVYVERGNPDRTGCKDIYEESFLIYEECAKFNHIWGSR